ncbi:MAG: hypothetical protein CVV64_01390 [Candidatus Wallbacteria bacterium HGW-Wallbacteria-1]|uniref:FlgD Ig-like domain-containing protein n=1 Tax=Candidatus Wallbacteria bacterium HGW-Wallbacteria-1 TaxID=2013854 RepID=A0A2N1PUT1_9BACT|nr:MAG: hypothetical protein CVV64_01390 [Candidatus Wallbacteria bacterium HGW-Wallbacteria-1]
MKVRQIHISEKTETPARTDISIMILTILLIAGIVMTPVNQASAADAQTRGLCGTCRLSLVNTGKYMYKSTARQEYSAERHASFTAQHSRSASDENTGSSAATLREYIQLGTLKDFQVLKFDRKPFETIRAEAVKIGSHCVVFKDQSVDVGDTQATMVAYQFDDVIYPKTRNLLGQEPNTGMDGDSRVYILLTDLKDPEGSEWHTRGYYNPADLHAKSLDNPTTNEMEVLYLDVNPQVPGSSEFFQSLAHQFAHMVLYNMDTAGGGTGVREHLWVDEGLALLAQYICDYGHPHEYIEAYLANTNTPLTLQDIRSWASEDPRANYGASYLFTLYCYEHFGDEFIRRWARTAEDGTKGFDVAMKATARSDTFETVFADWTVANLLDDVSVKDVASYGNFGYRHLDLEASVPAANRYSRFPLFPRTLDISRHGVFYISFSDAEASYLNLLFDAVDMPNEFLIRTISTLSDGSTVVDVLPVIQNPTKLSEKKYTMNIPHFGTDTTSVTLILSQIMEEGYGQGEISASIAGPRFSVFFNPVLPGYVTVSVMSLVTPHAYAWQHGMATDLSILLKKAGGEIYTGSYLVDRTYPGTATFWAQGMGPDRTTGTIKWKVDIVNVAAGDKANVFFPGVNLKTSAASQPTTILAMESGCSVPDGMLTTGKGIDFTDLQSGQGAGPYDLEIELDRNMAIDPRASIYRVSGKSIIPIPCMKRVTEDRGIISAKPEQAGSYMVLLDNSPPEIESATLLQSKDGYGFELNATVADIGTGPDREATLVTSTGQVSEMSWEPLAQGAWLLRARLEKASELTIIPVDGAGNSGSSAKVTATAAAGGITVRAYPCPASTTAELELMSGTALTEVKVEIFDFAGHRINSLLLSNWAGSWKSTWNLQNQDGEAVSNGTYILRFRSLDPTGHENRQTSKLSVLR